jgi:hypothetical protein
MNERQDLKPSFCQERQDSCRKQAGGILPDSASRPLTIDPRTDQSLAHCAYGVQRADVVMW